ncbi:hypothetical protein BKA83DRAFT_4502458 [Pisolithus microcarpus]|nr:hypothetical protein BKA83DRAFT_4502458 [Pisolithus microcarpus]
MSSTMQCPLERVMQVLENSGSTVSEFMLSLLSSSQYKDHPFVHDLITRSADIFSILMQHCADDDRLLKRATDVLKGVYRAELREITSEERGWHFGAMGVTTKQLEGFSIDDMARDMEICAPELWRLLGMLLDDERMGNKPEEDCRDDLLTEGDDEYWNAVDEIDLEGFIAGLTTEGRSSPASLDKRSCRHAAVVKIVRKKVVVMSILMQSMNQKANALQSILGIFFQSTHTPQKVIDTLAHVGISISTETVNGAIRSLSAESQNHLRSLGQSLLASYAYDNFDVDLKPHVPTVEKSHDSLKHLTSGMIFPLGHGVTTDDLRCSEELWEQSAINPNVEDIRLPSRRSWTALLSINPETSTPIRLTRRERYNAWMFLSDLCTHGPEYFRTLKGGITEPEAIDQIPLVKTEIIAARAMDVNNSTVSGNIRAVADLLRQGGIYDPAAVAAEGLDAPDISRYVVLIHGDLGTGERLQAVQLQRSIEATPWDRFQHVVFVPGLFHLKMACAEAIWRCFLQPLAAREDETSLIHDVTILRPRETGIYCSKPGFRRMHQLISHAGVCRRLDCWRLHIEDLGFTSLEAFAASAPTLDDLKTVAEHLVRNYVANYQLRHMKARPSDERDIQFENALLMNKYYLLYEELSYAMNRGDIGRVETCIVPWIPILKAVGKHKYATQMMNFLTNVHYVYPPGLRHAIRYHWLVNPTGKEMKWRAVDWCVELNNLFTKATPQVKYGGKGSNRTLDRILLESPLVQAYRNAQVMIQKNFLHTHLTVKHGDPNMSKSFKALTMRFESHSPHRRIAGRKSRYEILDLADKGRELMEKGMRDEVERSENTEDTEARMGMDDVLVELL